MARPNVPKFGNWENEDNTPYTVYFEKARQTRGTGKIMNPNDPEENPDMFPNLAPPPTAPSQPKPKTQTEEPIGRGGEPRQTRERRMSSEDGELRQYANSPARNENMGRRASNDLSHQRGHGGRGSSSGRTGRQSAGSEHSFDKSPLHPHYQAKVAAGRGAASPAREGKNNSYDSSHGTPGRSFESAHATPGRSRIKQDSKCCHTPVRTCKYYAFVEDPTRVWETMEDQSNIAEKYLKQPDRGAAVPRFGDWDENDPQSADNYTHIFNKVREEKQMGSGNPSGTPSRTPYNTQRHNSDEKRMKCCFCFF